MKNAITFFRSYDESKTLILNTTGRGYLFDEEKQTIISNKISFGKEFFRPQVIPHKNGYYFVNKNDEIEWFDIATQKITKADICGSYWGLYPDKDREKAFFVSIDNCGTEQSEFLPIGYSLSIKCFSKTLERFEDWSFSLPKGTLEHFRHIYNNYYLVVMEEEKKTAKALIHTRVYLFDLEQKSLTFLFDVLDFCISGNEGYFINLEIDLNRKRAYILYSSVLKIVDLESKEIISSVELQYSSDLKIISDTLVIATWKGVFAFKLTEFD